MFRPNPVLRMLQKALQGVVEMRWQYAALTAFAHAVIAFAGLKMLGEEHLVSSIIQFTYYYIVTASSVGYGDLSPASDLGKLFVSVWVVPGALGIFALLLGRIAATIVTVLRKIMNGFGNFSGKTGHIVVLGHVPGQTQKLLDETRRLHGNRDVVVLAAADIAAQQTDWKFIRASSLSNRDDIQRAGIRGADFVVILGRDDDESLAASLAVAALEPRGHVVAYFRQAGSAELVRAHCENIEVVTSTSVEQVARALSDPGAGQVLHDLASTRTGATLNSLTFRGAPTIAAGELGPWLRRTYRATLMGYRDRNSGAPIMDFGEEDQILEGQTVFYVAGSRLPDDFTYTGDNRLSAA